MEVMKSHPHYWLCVPVSLSLCFLSINKKAYTRVGRIEIHDLHDLHDPG
jgi:hypothetical protein